MASAGSAVVEQSTGDPKFEGLNLASIGTGKWEEPKLKRLFWKKT
jgi:hypothetical protein